MLTSSLFPGALIAIHGRGMGVTVIRVLGKDVAQTIGQTQAELIKARALFESASGED
jgi:hypothetical protein